MELDINKALKFTNDLLVQENNEVLTNLEKRIFEAI